jgi:hypothetical protein
VKAPILPVTQFTMIARFVPLLAVVLPMLVSGCRQRNLDPAAATSRPDHTPAPSADTGKPSPAPPTKPAALLAAKPLGSTNWVSMFNGHDLTGWKRTDFGGGSEPAVENGRILIPMSASLGGVNWTNLAGFPTTNYEMEFDAMKIDGSDFFCGLTFPVGDTHCSFILGGWGGGVVGISSIDGQDASSNETTTSLYLERNRWFPIRLRVTTDKIMVWVDGKPVVDLETADKKITMRYGEIEMSKPLGIATYQTTAAFRNLRFRRLP